MPNTPVIMQTTHRHVEHAVHTEPYERAVDGPRRIGLSSLDLTAATAYVAMDASDEQELQRLTHGSAMSMAVGTHWERNEARIRLTARAIATNRTQAQTLEVALAQCVANGDERRALLISRILDGVTRRLANWLEEHRMSCGAGQRPVSVAIGAAAAVTIVSEE